MPKFQVLIVKSLKAYLSKIIAILFNMPIVSFQWKQVAWPKTLYERESTELNSHAQNPPSLWPLYFVPFGSVGDGRVCIGSIMLILASTVVTLRHDHGRFKAKKFTQGSN
jgi:hypothetical protein